MTTSTVTELVATPRAPVLFPDASAASSIAARSVLRRCATHVESGQHGAFVDRLPADLEVRHDARGLVFKIVGFLPLITGIVGWCPVYALFGVSSCPRTSVGGGLAS